MKIKLEQIIAEASAFSEFDTRTDDAFIRIRDLATEVLTALLRLNEKERA